MDCQKILSLKCHKFLGYQICQRFLRFKWQSQFLLEAKYVGCSLAWTITLQPCNLESFG